MQDGELAGDPRRFVGFRRALEDGLGAELVAALGVGEAKHAAKGVQPQLRQRGDTAARCGDGDGGSLEEEVAARPDRQPHVVEVYERALRRHLADIGVGPDAFTEPRADARQPEVQQRVREAVEEVAERRHPPAPFPRCSFRRRRS